MSDRTCEHYDEYDVTEPTCGQIINTLAKCGLRVRIVPSEVASNVTVEIARCLGPIYAEVKSRTSAEDALRRAWNRRKVQKIVEARMK